MTDASSGVLQAVLSLEEVQRDILAWDYYDIVSGSISRGARLEPVPARFESLAQYSRVFRALLLEELRAHILQVRYWIS